MSLLLLGCAKGCGGIVLVSGCVGVSPETVLGGFSENKERSVEVFESLIDRIGHVAGQETEFTNVIGRNRVVPALQHFVTGLARHQDGGNHDKDERHKAHQSKGQKELGP